MKKQLIKFLTCNTQQEICSINSLYQTSKLSPKETRKRRAKKLNKTDVKKNILKAEINKILNEHTIQGLNEPNTLLIEKINTFNKPLARTMKERRIKTQITNIWLKDGISLQVIE